MAVRVPAELVERDPEVIAPLIGLEYIPDDQPGIGRHRNRSTDEFRYENAFGTAVTAKRVREIEQLAVPPAWSEVWISPSPDGYLQATGTDDAERKQYRYHDEFRRFSAERKFARLPHFGRALPHLRKASRSALDQPLGSRDHAIAAAVTLIDAALLRVGNHQSANHGHYGATTLTVDHVVDDGLIALEYTAKSGQDRHVTVDDPELAAILAELAADADDELFWFDDGNGDGRRRAQASDINRFVSEHGGPAFSAKDFRTWGGSRSALEARATGADLIEAVDAAAAELGNTRAVARSAYIHPAVTEASDDTIADAWSSSRSSTWMDRAESALIKVLASPHLVSDTR